MRNKLRIIAIVLGLVCFGVTAGVAPMTQAQTQEEVVSAPTERSALSKATSALGIWIFPLGLLAIAAIGLLVYNGILLMRKKFIPAIMLPQLEEHMENLRVRSAIEMANTDPSFLARMCSHSLLKIDATDAETLGREKVEEAVAEFTVDENRKSMFWISLFGTIAQVSPMMGLLGTVHGMIKAFNVMGGSGQADPGKLATQIELALYTTAAGLVIAIPCIFGYFFYKSKLQKMVAASHTAIGKMLDKSILTINGNDPLAKIPEGLGE